MKKIIGVLMVVLPIVVAICFITYSIFIKHGFVYSFAVLAAAIGIFIYAYITVEMLDS